jgi:aryl-alcohol dehydrogenase-like predicted oxidoreductase
MDLRTLGDTGLMVSPIGLGTVKLGRTMGLKYPGGATMPDDEEALVLLASARKLGVNLVDTSPAYGTSEARLGKLLWQTGTREDWVVCTKVGEAFDEQSGRSTYDFSAEAIRDSVERSTERLGVEVIDIVLLHFASRGDLDEQTLRLGEAMGALRGLQAEGLVRAVGASTGSIAGGMLAMGQSDVVMVTLNAQDLSQMPVIEAAAMHGVGVLVKKPLASGKADPAASVKMVLATPGVSSAVVGTTNRAHLAELAV